MNGREEWRQVTRLHRWDRLIAKRSVRSRTFYVLLTYVLPVLLFAVVIFVSIQVVATVLTTISPTEQASVIEYVMLAAGLFLFYLQFLAIYNRLCVLPYELLLASPLRGRTILLVRVFSACISACLYALLGVPFAFSYGITTGAPVWYYPVSLFILLLTTVSLLILDILVVLIGLRFTRKRIARESLAFFSSLVAIAFVLVPRLVSAGTLQARVQSGLHNPAWSLLPMVWGARALLAGDRGHVAGTLLYVLLLLVTCVAGGWLALHTANRTLHDRIGRIQEGGTVRKRRMRRRQRTGVAFAQPLTQKRRDSRVLPLAVKAMVHKDWLRLRRTPSELLSFAVSGLYFWFILQHPGQGQTPATPGLILPWLVVLVAFSTSRLTLSSFGIERSQITLVLSSPLTTAQLLFSKWLYAFVPSLLWIEAITFLYDRLTGMPWTVVFLLALCSSWFMAGAVLIILPFAVRGASFTVRKTGQRNVYVLPGAGFSVFAMAPYAGLQGAVMLYLISPYVNGGTSFFATWLVSAPLGHMVLGLLVSLILSAVACAIGWSIAKEGWRNRKLLLLQSGSLDS